MSAPENPTTIIAADLPPSPPKSKRRGAPGLHSMMLSMLVLTVILLAFYAIVARPEKMDRLPVDAVAAVKNARELSRMPFSALEPTPVGWKSNSALYQPGADGLRTWSVGYVHDDAFAGLAQVPGATSVWFSTQLEQAVRDGDQSVGGTTWERWHSPKTNDHLLVKRGTGQALSTIVTSSVSYDDAAAFVARLTPKP